MLKKICIITGQFPARPETFVVEHAVGLARRGYDVTVLSEGVAPGISLAELDALDASGMRRVDIAAYGLSRARNLIQMLSRCIIRPKLLRSILPRGPWTRRELFLADAYREVISSLQPDALHVHYGSQAGALCRFGLMPHAIVTWHGYEANTLPARRRKGMYHELFSGRYQHTVGSQFMVDRLKSLGCASDKIHQIPMGVDLGKFIYVDRSERASSVLRIVSVGRLDEMKGHGYLIAAVSQLIQDGVPVRLRIIGEGPLRSQLEAQIHGGGVSGSVELLGAQDSETVRQELEAADLFALAGVEAANGRVETQGVVLIEAQATGLPVVASRVGGVPGSLIDGETGILCEPQNVDQVVQAVKMYAESQALRLAHGRAAQEFVKQHFSLAKMLDSFETLYGVNQCVCSK
jgi:colanic acid/amylovoran biosynthesis glycosyltransferase